jgi:acetyl esterase/lipase
LTFQFDPLRDEGDAYARKLKEAGVSVDAVRYNGTIHDFVVLNAIRHVPSLPRLPSGRSMIACVSISNHKTSNYDEGRRSCRPHLTFARGAKPFHRPRAYPVLTQPNRHASAHHP